MTVSLWRLKYGSCESLNLSGQVKNEEMELQGIHSRQWKELFRENIWKKVLVLSTWVLPPKYPLLYAISFKGV